MRIRALLSALVIVISAGWFACMDHNLAPVIQTIDTQQVMAKSAFIFDLAGYVADDKDAAGDLVFSKPADDNSDQFLGSLYINTYSVTGTYTVGFSVADSSDKTSSGSFDVEVVNSKAGNEAPVIAPCVRIVVAWNLRGRSPWKYLCFCHYHPVTFRMSGSKGSAIRCS